MFHYQTHTHREQITVRFCLLIFLGMSFLGFLAVSGTSSTFDNLAFGVESEPDPLGMDNWRRTPDGWQQIVFERSPAMEPSATWIAHNPVQNLHPLFVTAAELCLVLGALWLGPRKRSSRAV